MDMDIRNIGNKITEITGQIKGKLEPVGRSFSHNVLVLKGKIHDSTMDFIKANPKLENTINRTSDLFISIRSKASTISEKVRTSISTNPNISKLTQYTSSKLEKTEERISNALGSVKEFTQKTITESRVYNALDEMVTSKRKRPDSGDELIERETKRAKLEEISLLEQELLTDRKVVTPRIENNQHSSLEIEENLRDSKIIRKENDEHVIEQQSNSLERSDQQDELAIQREQISKNLSSQNLSENVNSNNTNIEPERPSPSSRRY